MTPQDHVQIEICVDDLAGAMAAEANGADRIELCAGLSEGGVTPSLGLVRTVLDRVSRIGLRVMIRPRGGDFTVSPDELDVMLADIALVRALVPEPRIGFVFGVLDGDDRIDLAAVRRLKAACGAASTTFHKAFDRIGDQHAAMERLADLGIERVLTSGRAGGIRAANVRALLSATGVTEVHLRAMHSHPTRPPVTAPREIASLVEAVRDGSNHRSGQA